ncbi:hypothetical protein DEO72_LG6g1290 [Vigna unguiculata]|uniref:Uncharacterized protein n=1 Tax=Vigna unguiculata TaxID=3917 RepID=A0A4D6M9T0_VIGUN|nr:hypothetical protein DEO72_LG6g1290 [Vigna unguiculata]
MAKNIVIVFVPPSGSSSAARRFKEETQKMVLTLVSPGGSRVTARWFLEKFQKPDSSFDIHIKYNSNLSHTTIHSLKTKAIKRNSPNLDFLAQFAKCATSFLFVNLLLALLPIQTQNLTQHSQILSFCALFLDSNPSTLTQIKYSQPYELVLFHIIKWVSHKPGMYFSYFKSLDSHVYKEDYYGNGL